MKYIANIFTDENFNDIPLYNVTSARSDLISGIPTLIIGWDKTKKEYPEASIIEWKVSDDVYWTYGKYEKRDRYEINIKRFQDLAFKKFIDALEYVFYDILTSPENKFESFLNSLVSDVRKTIYVSGDMMYIYYEKTNKVVGLSLRDCDYLETNIKKRLFSYVFQSRTISLLKNSDEVPKEIRFKIKGRQYLIPYLYS